MEGMEMKVRTLIKALQKLKNQDAELFYDEEHYPQHTRRLRITKNFKTPLGLYRGRDEEYFIIFQERFYEDDEQRNSSCIHKYTTRARVR